jgi:hypothetical protein
MPLAMLRFHALPPWLHTMADDWVESPRVIATWKIVLFFMPRGSWLKKIKKNLFIKNNMDFFLLKIFF